MGITLYFQSIGLISSLELKINSNPDAVGKKNQEEKLFSGITHKRGKGERMYRISLAQKYRDDLMTQENNNDA